MKRKNGKRALGYAAFLMLVMFCVLGGARIVERKNSREKLQPFLDNPKEFDVLFIGDSHMVNAVFPMELWRKYGIASYNLAGVGNTVPISYWSMMFALDVAAPKLVVIDVKDVDKRYKIAGNSGELHDTLDAIPLGWTKLRAVMDILDDPDTVDDDGNAYADMKWEYLFTLGKYHGRWKELQAKDFRPAPNRQKGALMMTGVSVPNDYDIIDEWETDDGDGVGYEYLCRMIEACQARGIGVLLTHLPYPAARDAQAAANTVRGIAEEYGVDYIDFVALDQVVDYATDCHDAFSHLNPSGARKVTDYLGRYITDHFDLPDRRTDEAYAHWNDDYADYTRLKAETLRGQREALRALMLLHDEGFHAVIHVRGGAKAMEDERTALALQNIAREHIYEEDAFAKWSDSLFPLEKLEQARETGEDYLLVVDRNRNCCMEFAGDAGAHIETSFGGLDCSTKEGTGTLTFTRDGNTRTLLSGQEEIGVSIFDRDTGELATTITL